MISIFIQKSFHQLKREKKEKQKGETSEERQKEKVTERENATTIRIKSDKKKNEDITLHQEQTHHDIVIITVHDP
jgi:uncharacterized membrane protein YhiD involved in acid resistance